MRSTLYIQVTTNQITYIQIISQKHESVKDVIILFLNVPLFVKILSEGDKKKIWEKHVIKWGENETHAWSY